MCTAKLLVSLDEKLPIMSESLLRDDLRIHCHTKYKKHATSGEYKNVYIES